MKPVNPQAEFSMLTPQVRARLSFLLLLFSGTICNSMIVPFMGFFIVEGLGHEPWTISVYTFLAILLAITANRTFASLIDRGLRVFPLVGIAAFGQLSASLALAVVPNLWTVLTIGVLGFGLSSSAVSTMFSLGGNMAERHNMERSRFNAYMRATTSSAWMVGPALSFLIADMAGVSRVFIVTATAAIIWLALWYKTLPREIAAPARGAKGTEVGAPKGMSALWIAAAFVFCLSLAHSLSFTALPLFYVQEVGLPDFAPGLAFSIKTFVEVLAIFTTPFIIARIGLWLALLITSMFAVLTIVVLASVQTFPQMLGAAAMEGLYYGFFASLGISYVQSFARHRPAYATALYWNTVMGTGLLAGPAVGFIAQLYSFQSALHLATGVAMVATVVLVASRRLKGAA